MEPKRAPSSAPARSLRHYYRDIISPAAFCRYPSADVTSCSGATMKERHSLFIALVGGVSLLATAPGALAQTEGPGRALAPSNNLRLSANTARSTTQTFPITLKQFYVPYTGTVRVKWQSKTSNAAASITISVTSNLASCNAPTTSTVYQNDQCDIRVSAGGSLIIMAAANFFAPSTAFVRNVRVFYDVVDFDGLGAVLQD